MQMKSHCFSFVNVICILEQYCFLSFISFVLHHPCPVPTKRPTLSHIYIVLSVFGLMFLE